MSTKLLNGTEIIELKSRYNGKEVQCSCSDANVYIIDNTNKLLSEVQRWKVRPVGGEIDCLISSFDSEVLQLTNIGDASEIRKKEVVSVYNVTDEYMGSLAIQSINETTGEVYYGFSSGVFDLTDMTYIKLEPDVLLVDGEVLTIESSYVPYLVVDGTCNFTIIGLDSGFIKK